MRSRPRWTCDGKLRVNHSKASLVVSYISTSEGLKNWMARIGPGPGTPIRDTRDCTHLLQSEVCIVTI